MKMSVAFLLQVVLLASAFAVEGCKDLPPPDGCAPQTTRCAPDGEPETCSPERRWTRRLGIVPCREVPQTRCCLVTSPYTRRNVHACVASVACLPDVDAGVVATDGGVL